MEIFLALGMATKWSHRACAALIVYHCVAVYCMMIVSSDPFVWVWNLGLISTLYRCAVGDADELPTTTTRAALNNNDEDEAAPSLNSLRAPSTPWFSTSSLLPRVVGVATLLWGAYSPTAFNLYSGDDAATAQRIGHLRGASPLPPTLQKFMVDFGNQKGCLNPGQWADTHDVGLVIGRAPQYISEHLGAGHFVDVMEFSRAFPPLVWEPHRRLVRVFRCVDGSCADEWRCDQSDVSCEADRLQGSCQCQQGAQKKRLDEITTATVCEVNSV